MFLLRRTAVRAIAATPANALRVQPRSITSISPAAIRLRQQSWVAASFQRRFASDDVTRTDSAEAAAAEAADFAQTAAEAPIEQNLSPAQNNAQAEPTNTDTLEVPETRRPQKVFDSTPARPGKVLYVGNLYYEVTEEQLKRVFSRFGNVESLRMVFDNRGLSKGFGYVEFENIPDAQAAIDTLNTQVFEGRNLVVQFHRPRTGPKKTERPSINNPPSDTLFIGNMSFDMSDRDLNDVFRDTPNVVDIRVSIDRRTGQPRGFAHAEFVDVASATKAKEMLQGKVIYGRELRLDFSKSVPRALRGSRADSAQEF